jgi:hypothetical protein
MYALIGLLACTREVGVNERKETIVVDVPVVQLDVLVTLDASRSMATEWLPVRTQLLDMGVHLDRRPDNLRLGVGFPDVLEASHRLEPEYRPRLARPPSVESHLMSVIPSDYLDAAVSTHGGFGEYAWAFLAGVLAPGHPTTPPDFFAAGNAGLLVVVSDDSDYSEVPTDPQFLAWLERRTNVSPHFRYHAVVDPGLPSPSCGGGNSRHLLAAAATGGAVLDLCAPNAWGTQLVALVDEAFDTLTLTSLPPAPCAEATLTLTSGGEPWEACAPYDTGSRSEPCPEWTWDAAAGELWIPLRLRHASLTATLTRPEGCR